MRLELEEDVETELEDFVVLARLGLNKEAYEFILHILWPHAHLFPVFVECANFLLEKWYRDDLSRLLKMYEASGSNQSHHADERQFFELVSFLAKGSKFMLKQAISKGDESWTALWDPDRIDFDSAAQIHTAELLFSNTMDCYDLPNLCVQRAFLLIQYLLDRKIYSVAAHIFASLCITVIWASRSETQLREIHTAYLSFADNVMSSTTDDPDRLNNPDTRIAKCIATNAYLKYLDYKDRAWYVPTYTYRKERMLQSLKADLDFLFSISPIKMPSGLIFESFQAISRRFPSQVDRPSIPSGSLDSGLAYRSLITNMSDEISRSSSVLPSNSQISHAMLNKEVATRTVEPSETGQLHVDLKELQNILDRANEVDVSLHRDFEDHFREAYRTARESHTHGLASFSSNVVLKKEESVTRQMHREYESLLTLPDNGPSYTPLGNAHTMKDGSVSRGNVYEDYRLKPAAIDPVFGDLAKISSVGESSLSLISQAATNSEPISEDPVAIEPPSPP